MDSLIGAMLTALVVSLPLQADEALAPSESDVTQVTCGELAMESETDRAFALVFYYGYLAGQEAVEIIDSDLVAGHLDAVRSFCNENPEATVIEAFVRSRHR